MKSKIKSIIYIEMGGLFSAISAPAKAMSMTNANISREFSVGPQPNTSRSNTSVPNASVPNASVPNSSTASSTPNVSGSPATRRNRRQSGGKSRRRHRKSRTRRH